jgi:hypothetical protein
LPRAQREGFRGLKRRGRTRGSTRPGHRLAAPTTRRHPDRLASAERPDAVAGCGPAAKPRSGGVRGDPQQMHRPALHLDHQQHVQPDQADVSTVKKSVTSSPPAWACRNWLQVGPPRRGAGPETVPAQDPPHRAHRDPHAEGAALPHDPHIPPSGILPRQPHHQRDELLLYTTPVATSRRVGPPAGDQLPMPAQQRRGRDQQDRPPPPAAATSPARPTPPDRPGCTADVAPGGVAPPPDAEASRSPPRPRSASGPSPQRPEPGGGHTDQSPFAAVIAQAGSPALSRPHPGTDGVRGYTRRCSKAYAAAAVREPTSSLAKMFER